MPTTTPTKNAVSTPPTPRTIGSTTEPRLKPMNDIAEYCQTYARQKPEVVAFLCFGVGFILGWKLKPW